MSRGRLGGLSRHHWGRLGLADIAIVSDGGRGHGGHRGLVLVRVTRHGAVTIAVVREEMLRRGGPMGRPTAWVARLASWACWRPLVKLRLSRVMWRPGPLS